jgi:Mrp family chromosome partitioning ATPase
MDHIKRALELSRTTRVGQAGRVMERATAQAPPSALPQTRSVRPDAALLMRQRVLAPGADDAAAQAYRMLRTQTLQLLRKHHFNSLAVVSPSPDDGRTLTAINLAIAIGEDPNQTALLVDMDLRKPSVNRYLGLTVTRGVGDCLREQCSLAESLVRLEGYTQLVLLPGAAPLPLSTELLSGDGARRLTTELRQRYADRIVIYDLPPLLATDDALAFLPQVQAVLLVACEGRTRREDVLRCMELIGRTPLVGTVLNGSRESTPAYA